MHMMSQQELLSLGQQCHTLLAEHSLSHMFSHQLVSVL